MKRIITKRKEENGVNIEFQITPKFDNKIEPLFYKEKIPTTISLNNIISDIKSSKKYYTKNLDESLSEVIVKGGDKVEEYISSPSNDGTFDNIDKLSTY